MCRRPCFDGDLLPAYKMLYAGRVPLLFPLPSLTSRVFTSITLGSHMWLHAMLVEHRQTERKSRRRHRRLTTIVAQHKLSNWTMRECGGLHLALQCNIHRYLCQTGMESQPGPEAGVVAGHAMTNGDRRALKRCGMHEQHGDNNGVDAPSMRRTTL